MRTEKDEGGDKVWGEFSSPIYVFLSEEYVGTFFPSSMRFRQSNKGAKDEVGLRLDEWNQAFRANDAGQC